jgi:hypothetical protein
MTLITNGLTSVLAALPFLLVLVAMTGTLG